MNKNNPLVSIIIPFYNVEPYFEDCLKSVIAQDYKNLDIILVDDGSTDNCNAIAQKFANNDRRIRIVEQENQGLSSARNAGLKHVRGEYVCFVDSDDKITSDMISYLLSGDADVNICSHYEYFENGNLVNFNKGFSQVSLDSESAVKAMLLENGFMVSAWGKLFKATLFKDVEFPVGKLHEDIGTTYKALLKAESITFLPEPKYLYRQRANSISKATKFDERKFDIIELTDQMCDEIDSEYPALNDATSLRRMHARFSVLRQIPRPHTRAKELIRYLKENKSNILNNPYAATRDRVALRLALTNIATFQFAYRIMSVL